MNANCYERFNHDCTLMTVEVFLEILSVAERFLALIAFKRPFTWELLKAFLVKTNCNCVFNIN